MGERGNEFELWPSRFIKPNCDGDKGLHIPATANKNLKTVMSYCKECQAPTPHSWKHGCLVCKEAKDGNRSTENTGV